MIIEPSNEPRGEGNGWCKCLEADAKCFIVYDDADFPVASFDRKEDAEKYVDENDSIPLTKAELSAWIDNEIKRAYVRQEEARKEDIPYPGVITWNNGAISTLEDLRAIIENPMRFEQYAKRHQLLGRKNVTEF